MSGYAANVGRAPRARRFSVLLALLALVTAVAFGVGSSAASALAPAADNPVVAENRHPGTQAWVLGHGGAKPSTDTGRQIQGYASATSVERGGRIGLHVTASPAQTFTTQIFRMGWYQGLGGRLMTSLGPVRASTQPVCAPDARTGLTDCGWSETTTVTVPKTWTSGVYLALLTNQRGFQSYITFVVRDDTRKADLLYQQAVTTYQAYNPYPDDGSTGKSLYDNGSSGPEVPATGAKRAAMVSFNRPYSHGYGSGQFMFSWDWERYFIGWMEKSGYDVTYSTDLDTHTHPERLKSVRGLVSAGHDEYWSSTMRDGIDAALAHGTGMGFFGSNTGYWQVRFEPDAAGHPLRTMVCYKDAGRDPASGTERTVRFRDPQIDRPEQKLFGVQFTSHLRDDGKGQDFTVTHPEHWVWKGTGVQDGTRIPGILGYEVDRVFPGVSPPGALDLTVLADSPGISETGDLDRQNAVAYTAPSGAVVFASGTNHWSYGLGKEGVTDPRIQRATANVLDRLVAGPVKTATSGQVFVEDFGDASGGTWPRDRWESTLTEALMDHGLGRGHLQVRAGEGSVVVAGATMAGLTDSDTRLSFQLSGGWARADLVVVARGEGAWRGGTPTRGVEVRVDSGSGTVSLGRAGGGRGSFVRGSGIAATDGERQWLRLQVEGDNARVKIWPEGATEPAEWSLTWRGVEATSGILQVGLVGGAGWFGSVDADLDHLQVSRLG